MRKLPMASSSGHWSDYESSRIGGYLVQPNLFFYVQCRQEAQLE